MNTTLLQAIKHWNYISPLLQYPKNQKEFDALVSQLDELLMIVGENEKHPLMGLLDLLSNFIEFYEEEHFAMPQKMGVKALRHLMDIHKLKQSDLPEIASQGVLSQILNGKRQLNLRQIKLLAKKFNVDPSTFIDN